MKTVISLVLAASMACASVAFAQDAMQPASAGSAMKQDAMKSGDAMKKPAAGQAMKHSGKPMSNGMKAGDAMQQGDGMNKQATPPATDAMKSGGQ
ncbi:hypothetical protein [Dyella sp. C9]|uniref:hypothetical protein n=1 Tax=Dyella sp. C9 TaxID=2202154 RepID=UPI000DEF1D57|nr:hypothetical protein [Dyella sp. C9]